MSSFFSTDEVGNTHREDLFQQDSNFDIAATAYNLNLDKTSVPLAISSFDSERTGDIANNLEADIWQESSLLTAHFSKGNFFRSAAGESRQGSATVDELTGDELTGLSLQEGLLSVSSATVPVGTISGELTQNDESNPTRQNAFKDDYLLSPQQSETIQIDLESSVFDTYLQIVDANTGALIDSNDDVAEGQSNSQLSFTTEAGRQYLIRATSYFEAATGAYNLTIQSGSGDDPSPPTDTSNSFNDLYGYGGVDAASAVAAAVGKSRFGNVADIGGNQWNNDMVYAPEAWAQGYTGQGVTVAVIDSGVDFTHSDLSNSMWINTNDAFGDNIDNDNNGYIDDIFGWNFGVGQNNNNILPGTENSGQEHGTHVAGTIAAANDGIGMTGVAHNAKIMALRLGDNNSDGSPRNWGDLAQAIRYAVDNGANVINMSLGGGSDSDGRIREALDYAASRNVVAVMAAGNGGNQNLPMMPARYATDYGISVGAVASNGAIADFSNQAGTDSRMHHVMAPGVGIYSTGLSNSWFYEQGTSMAAPHVAGVVALMLSANPNLTHAQVREILTGTATLATASTNSVLASSASSSEQGILAANANNDWVRFTTDGLTTRPVLNKPEPVASLYEVESTVESSFYLANAKAIARSESISENRQMFNPWQFQLPQPSSDKLLAPMMA